MIIFRTLVLLLVVLFFGVAGILHFTRDAMFAAIVPPYVPYPYFMVYFTGVAECLGALGLTFGALFSEPKLRLMAGWGLIVLSILVFPANVYMALNPEQFNHISPQALYVRLPLQLVIIGAIYFSMQGSVLAFARPSVLSKT